MLRSSNSLPLEGIPPFPSRSKTFQGIEIPKTTSSRTRTQPQSSGKCLHYWVKNGSRINEIFPNFLASALNVYSYRATELEPELGL